MNDKELDALVPEQYYKVLEFIDDNLSIDEHRLEQECKVQIDMVDALTSKLPYVKAWAKQVKEDTDTLKETLALDVRKFPEKYGLAKVTEGAILSTVQSHPTYVKARKEQIEAEFLADKFSQKFESLSQRKSMLKILDDLFVFRYYSSVDLSLGGKGQRQEAIVSDINDLMKDRKDGEEEDRGSGSN